MQKISYSGVGTHFKYAKGMNKRLEELGGKIPDNEIWFGQGQGLDVNLCRQFDNEGNPIRFVECENEYVEDSISVRVTHLDKIYEPIMWIYVSCEYKDNKDVIQLKEDLHLYYTYLQNNFSTPVKTALPGYSTRSTKY